LSAKQIYSKNGPLGSPPTGSPATRAQILLPILSRPIILLLDLLVIRKRL